MVQFKDYLNKTKEIGYVEKVSSSIIYVRGLPEVRTAELVIFETGQIGQVYSLTTDYVEVLLLTKGIVAIGTKVARTNETLKIGVGDYLLGKTLNPLAQPIDGKDITEKPSEYRLVDINPPGINLRKNIDKPFETGVTIVDLVTPLGKGQRELVIGDRKTNKTQFLLQVLYSQAIKGTVCIYTAIAKRKLDIIMIKNFLANSSINQNTILLASSPDEVPGLIFLTPYTAITIAEHFRDQGRDVLIILDDMTAHAKYYREISLLAERFPGRSSYPGDIFYIHAKIMERAGNFILREKETASAKNQDNKGDNLREVSITCLPVAEMVMGDFSGYIQTNLMAMTDGHIYFDREYFNQGRRPAVNPFLSVTRVGRQAQTELLKDLSRVLTSFLVHHEKLRQFMHFGAELSEETRRNLDLGDKILTLFEQPSNVFVPLNLSLVLFSCIWAGIWKEKDLVDLKNEIKKFSAKYMSDKSFKDRIDALIAQSNNFVNLIDTLRNNQADILQTLAQPKTL
jgi:F-type H+-transporting ATPase subunit alpha